MSGYAFRGFLALCIPIGTAVVAGIGWANHWNAYTNLSLTLGAVVLFWTWAAGT